MFSEQCSVFGVLFGNFFVFVRCLFCSALSVRTESCSVFGVLFGGSSRTLFCSVFCSVGADVLFGVLFGSFHAVPSSPQSSSQAVPSSLGDCSGNCLGTACSMFCSVFCSALKRCFVRRFVREPFGVQRSVFSSGTVRRSVFCSQNKCFVHLAKFWLNMFGVQPTAFRSSPLNC